VLQLDSHRMQRKPGKGIQRGPEAPIAKHGVAHRPAVDANGILASGVEPDGQQRHPPRSIGRQDAPMGCCGMAPVFLGAAGPKAPSPRAPRRLPPTPRWEASHGALDHAARSPPGSNLDAFLRSPPDVSVNHPLDEDQVRPPERSAPQICDQGPEGFFAAGHQHQT